MVIIFCGIPGSGKSTVARRLREELEKRGRTELLVSDQIRSPVYRKIFRWLKENLDRADYIIIDATFHKTKWRDEVFMTAGADNVLVVHLHCSLKTCLERNKKRKPALPERVIYVIDRAMERPVHPDISIDTDEIGPEEAVSMILNRTRCAPQPAA
ncbi:MAG: AAA family ATPase [Thermodesulfobacteriota bacterium]